MTGSRAFWLAASLGLALAGCNSEIVLGDTPALPQPGPGGFGAAPGNPQPPPSGGSVSDPGTLPDPGSTPQPSLGLPRQGELVWSANHENGDLGEWEQGGELLGGEYDWGETAFGVDTDIGHRGSAGVFAYIDTSARGEPSQGVRLYRRTESGAAFYGAWFNLEESHTVADWWSISLFYARQDPLSMEETISLWDVRVVDTPDGGMALQFFDLDSMRGETASLQGRVQPGQWFELTLYLDYRPPDDTRIGVLLDGVELFDIEHLHSGLLSNVFWAVGNGAGDLSPSQSTLYVDDAFIRKPSSVP